MSRHGISRRELMALLGLGAASVVLPSTLRGAPLVRGPVGTDLEQSSDQARRLSPTDDLALRYADHAGTRPLAPADWLERVGLERDLASRGTATVGVWGWIRSRASGSEVAVVMN